MKRLDLKQNPNTIEYWNEQFQKEYDLIKTENIADGTTGYRWEPMRFGIVSNKIPFRGKILDIGCGLGNFCRYIKARNPELEIYGIDHSPSGIKLATKIEPNINYQVAEAYKLPFPDDYFDIVSAQEIIEHLDNPHRAIDEWKRVLKKGGKLHLTTPWYGICLESLGQTYGGMMSGEHLFEWTPPELSKEMSKHFKRVNIVFPPALVNIISQKSTFPVWIMAICEK